jgi:NH3-dependent NAD+ synthetase
MSVGYATLYGDMCGGFAVLKDVYKTTVYRLARWRNAQGKMLCSAEVGMAHAHAACSPSPARGEGEQASRDGHSAYRVIPERTITKAPSAELRPNQTDQDSLPPYDELDTILRGLIERSKSVHELVDEGMNEANVQRVAKLVLASEYKRRQSAPGVKITPMAFGRDRRWPITNKWKLG